MKFLSIALFSFLLVGCSAVGNSKVEIAPYTVVSKAQDAKIELREYESMVLVSTSMGTSKDGNRNGAFRKLFAYISGDNIDASKIPMTAPVFMDDKDDSKDMGTKIPMTAPVFMDKDGSNKMMSFIMPKEFTLKTTPKPTNPDVTVSEVNDYKVAVIQFSGTLSDSNVEKHKRLLETWIVEQGLEANGPYKTAGYNAPFVLPMLRRNEVLIPIK